MKFADISLRLFGILSDIIVANNIKCGFGCMVIRLPAYYIASKSTVELRSCVHPIRKQNF